MSLPTTHQVHNMRVIRILWVLLLSPGFCTSGLSAQDAADKYQLPDSDEGLPGAGPIRRYDWFRGLWKRKRTAFAAATQKDQGAVLFLGDSITQGWGDRMGNSFPGMKVANRGISGDTTRGMLIRLKEDVLDVNPKCVVMLMGTNDLEENATPATIAGNVKLIVEELGKHNAKMPIVLCQVMPSTANKKRSAKDITETNKLCAAAVRGNRQVTVLDTWTLFANADGDAKKEEFPDLLHPNAAGYAKWAAALRPVFATLKLSETDADTFVAETGFKPLFNGQDLTGWMIKATPEAQRKRLERRMKNNPNAIPWPIFKQDENLAGKAASSDGRYHAINGRLVVTTPTEGRRIQQLWTTEEFGEDFVLKLEFRATPNADSGVFIRGKQLQCRDFLLAGPYKKLTKYRPQLWNELVINVKGTKAHCTCNGEVLEKAFEVPESGPIGLEGDRGQIEYRRIRIGKDDGNLLRTTNRPESWRFETHADGKGSMKADGGTIVFKTEEVTDTDWHVQAYQAGLSLEEGKEYRVTFQMKSPDYSTVVIMAMSNAPDDYHPIGLADEFDTDPGFNDYEFVFTATDIIPGRSRIGFILGRDTGTVVLKNLKLVEVE